MAMGRPVIATGWSGNMDLMNVSNSFPVRYRLVELNEKVAQYPTGGVWAEPSVKDAARLMRHVFERRQEAAARGQLAQQEIGANYSNDAIGRALAERFDLISKRARFQEMRQRLREPVAADGFLEEFQELGGYEPAGQVG